MSRYLKPQLRGMEAYTPGEQPQDMQYIKLNTNESPFPPSPGVAAAVAGETGRLCLYPAPGSTPLRRALAAQYGVAAENVIVGNGSDEILNFCFQAFFAPGQPLRFPSITYGFYKVFADLYGLTYTEVPLKGDFSVDPADYRGQNAHIVLANPNAPTGIELPREHIEEIIKSNPEHIVVVDEAYVDFGGRSCAELIRTYKNLIVVMTFSKSRSLAGARVGFALADAALIRDLQTVQYATNPYNVNRLSQAAALAAVREADYYRQNCAVIVQNRAYVTERLERLGFRVLPSKTNFVFAESKSISGGALYAGLKQRGVLVRHFNRPPIENFVRITVGTREQLDVLLEKIQELLGGNPPCEKRN